VTRISAVDRRADLVRAALRVVARDGVTAATTRRIVAEAGMSLASFHYAFTSRSELMGELVDAVLAGEERALAPALQRDALTHVPTMREVVRAGLQSYFDGVRADPDREKAMFELTQWALREPGFEQLARRQYERYFELARSAAVAAAELSGCRWSIPVEEVARALVVLTDGLTMAWLVTRDDAAAAAAMDFAADALARLATSHPVPAPPDPSPGDR
jgi:AcrR family transcriptional regulator